MFKKPFNIKFYISLMIYYLSTSTVDKIWLLSYGGGGHTPYTFKEKGCNIRQIQLFNLVFLSLRGGNCCMFPWCVVHLLEKEDSDISDKTLKINLILSDIIIVANCIFGHIIFIRESRI